MDQVRIGSFLKELRKEKKLTQDCISGILPYPSASIAEEDMPKDRRSDSGERKSEDMNQESKNTAVKMAEYSRNEVKNGKQNAVGYLMSAFGIFTIISALAIFPNDSSWGSVYSILGSAVFITGFYLIIKSVLIKRSFRILSVVGCVILLAGVFTASDYIAVTRFNQVPRFSGVISYSSENPDEIVYKTLFFTAVRKNAGTEYEQVEIVR